MNSLNQSLNQDILDRTFRFAVRITKLGVFLVSRGGTGLVRPARLAPLIQEAEEIKRVVGAILVKTKANARSNRRNR